MDIGYYLGELLMQRGEVKVPGLGIFSQVRMSAYYDDNQHLFYPPHHKVHFEQQADVDDTALADYLATKKGISLASAKYFIEKYISNLKQQATVADVAVGNMGLFCTEYTELIFKPTDSSEADSELFGLTPVKIFKAGTITAPPAANSMPELVYPPKPRLAEPVEVEEKEKDDVFAEEPEEDKLSESAYDEAFLELPEQEEVEHRGPLRAILITVVFLAVIGGGLLALYRYQPATFAKLQFWKNNTPDTPVKARPSTIVIPGIDSLHTDTTNKALDTTANITDSVTRRFELISGKGFKNLWGANEAVKKYKKMGLKDAKLLEELPGPLTKVSIASFNTLNECEALRQQLIKEGKLTKGAYTLEIPQE